MHDWELEFIRGWAHNLEDLLAEETGNDDLSAVYQRWGVSCAELGGSVDLAEEIRNIAGDSGTMQAIVDEMNKNHLGGGHLQLDGDHIVGTYESCTCPVVNNGFARSAFQCECTKGWVRSVFSRALGRPVRVVLHKTILRGDGECRWTVIPQRRYLVE